MQNDWVFVAAFNTHGLYKMGLLGGGGPHLVRVDWLTVRLPLSFTAPEGGEGNGNSYVWAVHLLLTHVTLNSLRWFLFNTSCGSRYRLLKTSPVPPNSFHGGHWKNPLANNFLVATGPGCAGGTEVEMKGPVFHYRSPKWAAPWGDYDFFLQMKMYHLSLNAYCLSGANELAFNDSFLWGEAFV